MGQAIAAKCSERCGWVGWGVTGWKDATDEQAALVLASGGGAWVGLRLGEDDGRFRWRGSVLQYRARLRDTRCPRCGSIGLDRAPRLEAVERRR